MNHRDDDDPWNRRRQPPRPYRYWKDEVDRAERRAGAWVQLSLNTGCDLEDVKDWIRLLGSERESTSAADPATLATEFVALGVTPDDIRAVDPTVGNPSLVLRLQFGNITPAAVAEEIAEARRKAS